MIDYKQKYTELRAKFIESTDVAFRLGYEQGYNEGQNDQMKMTQQQPQIDPNTGLPIEQPGQQEQMDSMGQQQPQISSDMNIMDGQQGSELDQHINELESLVAKGEKPTIVSLRNVITKISDLRKSQKDYVKRAEKSVTWQKNVVNNLIKKMDEEASKLDEGLEFIINSEIKEEE
jgi:hypothetical protein